MVYSPAFTFASANPLGVLPCAGLRLWALRQFQSFLASSPCAASATSYHFASIAPLPWCSAFSRFAPVVKLGFPVLASGSNCAVKPTRLRRAAYFRSLGFWGEIEVKINLAHIRERSTSGGYIDFAVFDAKSTSGDNDALLAQLTAKARASGLKVDQSALAYTKNGRIQFYGSKNLVDHLSKSGLPQWTHEINV